MKTTKDYHNLLLKCDVLLLADVFEKFRNRCRKNYGLCLSHYLSTPALSWDAMLSMNKVELYLISEFDMYLIFEKRMRGVSYISKRYGNANNKYLTSYDPKKPTKYITYLDQINLYGYDVSKSLPTGGFKWLDPAKFDLDKYYNNSRGYVLEVDQEYPKELHELHNDYLLAPDKLDIKREMLSDYQLKIADDYISIGNAKK